MNEVDNGRSYKKTALKAAKELQYGDEVIARIKETDSEVRIRNIMAQAREDFWKGRD